MQSLQTITDTWGNWLAGKYKTTAKFTASTNYGAQSTLKKYLNFQVAATYQDITYVPANPARGQTVLNQGSMNNGSSTQQSKSISFTKTSSRTFNWSITEAISIGQSVAAGVEIPEVLSANVSTTTELSLSSTQGGQYTDEQSWTFNDPVVAPPNTTIVWESVVNFQTYNMDFVATVLLAGSVAVWFNKQVTLGKKAHNLFFFPIADVFNDVITNNLISTKGYGIVPGGVTTAAKGTFTGTQGISNQVNITEYPLDNTSVPPLNNHRVYGNVQSPATN